MISSYQEILNYEDDNWEDFLTKLDLYQVFNPILSISNDHSVVKGIIRYIVWVYSKSSDRIILDMELGRNKRKIFDDTNLHRDYAPMLIDLKSEVVLKVIDDWIDYQNEDISLQLLSLKELKREMQSASVSAIKKGNGLEIDYDQKFKNAQYVIELREMIKKVELELVQNDPKLKNITKEVLMVKTKNTFGIEKFSN